MTLALGLSCCAFAEALHHSGPAEAPRQFLNFRWFQLYGDTWLELGWVLDPLSAVMLVMVSLVGLLIFIYSLGYMAHDENFTRFFCFLSLFAAAMLGLVMANSLLLLFICWELVGLTSYLLIGFWYHKPSAAAAASKAFIVTRIGDLAFLLGIVWLYSRTHTLLFYDHGKGCLEHSTLAALMAQTTSLGLAASTGIALLIFCGAIGKSGQAPLHVWLPDAMEGPTPVSALIHAATMVAAGVFLVARMYPLMAAAPAATAGLPITLDPVSTTLKVITWVGVITAVFAATIAVAQTDIKRILAYSTISQLGFMMLGLGVGGVAVGMFHLITHAFFKALLFMGAGSVIHGSHGEQDIRNLGGLRKCMPVTFATYAIGMLALSGFPLAFSGFWSKDAILHAAHLWDVSRWPFYLGLLGSLLTAFYMTRQVCYVFLGPCRTGSQPPSHLEENGGGNGYSAGTLLGATSTDPTQAATLPRKPHESPGIMTVPLIILAVFSVVLGFIGTPAWPWFQTFLSGPRVTVESGALPIMVLSTIVVLAGLGAGWWLYGRRAPANADGLDAFELIRPDIFALLKKKYLVDEVYEWSVVRFNAALSKACDWLDSWVWGGLVQVFSYALLALSWVNRFFDEYVVNLGFDEGCRGLSRGGDLMSRLQDGRVQNYLRILGVALAALVLVLIWGCRAS